MHIGDDILRLAAGLKDQRPVTDPGCDDKVGIASLFMAFAALILSCQNTHVVERQELSAMGMSAQHKVGACLGQFVIFAGLVVQHDLVQIRIQAGHQFPGSHTVLAGLADGFVFAPDDIEPVVDELCLILQDSHAILLQILLEFVVGPAAAFLAEVRWSSRGLPR